MKTRRSTSWIALALAAALLVEGCAGQVARTSPSGAAPPPAERPVAESSGEVPRWVWWTACGVVLAAGLAVGLYFAIDEGVERSVSGAAGGGVGVGH